MLNQSDVARNWGVSRSYVNACVKRGCPLNSFEDARLWREAHARRRATTNAKQLAKLDDEARNYPHVGNGHKTGDILQDTLHNSTKAAEEAYRLLEEAMLEGKDSKISVRLAVHNKACEALIKVKSMIREEMERQKVLVPMNEAQDLVRKVIEIVVSRLSSMPQNIAARCNPHDPSHAMDILHHECIAIIGDAQKAVQG